MDELSLLAPHDAEDAALVTGRRRSPVVFQELQRRVQHLHPRFLGCAARTDPLAPTRTVLVPLLDGTYPIPADEADGLARALVSFVDRFRPDLPADRAGLLVPSEIQHGFTATRFLSYTPTVDGASVLCVEPGGEVLAKGPLVEVLQQVAVPGPDAPRAP